jgi:iron complex transport system ATP-binding protein
MIADAGPLLEVADLAFGFPGHELGAGVGFELKAGEVVCLLGPNGGGKTTLLKTLLGMLPPRAGRIRVGGCDLADLPQRRRAQALAYVPQAGTVGFPYTVAEVVLMGRASHRGLFAGPTAADRDAAAAALESLGLASLADRDWTRLSGGERQMVLVARALAQGSPVLILDEPTASLDFGNQVRVLGRIRELADHHGRAVLMSTHHPEQAFACADRVAILHRGRLLGPEAPEAAITPARMRDLYGLEVSVLVVPLEKGGSVRVCVPAALARRHPGS